MNLKRFSITVILSPTKPLERPWNVNGYGVDYADFGPNLMGTIPKIACQNAKKTENIRVFVSCFN